MEDGADCVALVKQECIWQWQQVDWLDDYLLAIHALRISKHTIAMLLWAPRWHNCDGSSKQGTNEHKRAWQLRLVLLGSLHDEARKGGGEGDRHTVAGEHEVPPPHLGLCTDIYPPL